MYVYRLDTVEGFEGKFRPCALTGDMSDFGISPVGG
jgi:hypothetical protein